MGRRPHALLGYGFFVKRDEWPDNLKAPDRMDAPEGEVFVEPVGDIDFGDHYFVGVKGCCVEVGPFEPEMVEGREVAGLITETEKLQAVAESADVDPEIGLVLAMRSC